MSARLLLSLLLLHLVLVHAQEINGLKEKGHKPAVYRSLAEDLPGKGENDSWAVDVEHLLEILVGYVLHEKRCRVFGFNDKHDLV